MSHNLPFLALFSWTIRDMQTTIKKEIVKNSVKKWQTTKNCESITTDYSQFVWIWRTSHTTQKILWHFVKKPLSWEVGDKMRNVKKLFYEQGKYDESCPINYSQYSRFHGRFYSLEAVFFISNAHIKAEKLWFYRLRFIL